MERLTMRIADTVGMTLEHEEKHTMDEWVDILQTRLCEYEDTGLTPEKIQELKTLAEQEKKGRLLQVPCHGEVLYEIDPEHGVVKHIVTDLHWTVDTIARDDRGMTWYDYYTSEEIETAYPTREAAEAALARLEG